VAPNNAHAERMNHLSDQCSRRDVLKTLGAGALLLGLSGVGQSRAQAAVASGAPGLMQPFALPKLSYDYAALEPQIDARTMEIHHSKHHQAYIDNANKALADYPELKSRSAEEILRDLGSVPEKIRVTVRNNVGGHVNHTFFWRTLGPGAGGEPAGEVAQAIVATFGSFEKFKAQFGDAAAKRFGSGWAWLVAKGGALSVVSTANQDSPLTDGAQPLLGLDVWEHAYYLKYQNRRAEYVAAFWNVVNWTEVAANYTAALAAK
jgi:Fe-Mn family superoxide dismutase